MNKERFFAANVLALITHAVVCSSLSPLIQGQPFDLVKIRAQVLQEGKTFNGIGWQRGWHFAQIFDEIHSTGGGLSKFWTS